MDPACLKVEIKNVILCIGTLSVAKPLVIGHLFPPGWKSMGEMMFPPGGGTNKHVLVSVKQESTIEGSFLVSTIEKENTKSHNEL